MPAISRHRFIVLPSSDAAPRVGEAGLAALPMDGAIEQPRLGLLQLGDVPAVLVENGAGGPHVARTGHRELELDALLLALAPQLVHLRAQGLRRLGGLSRFGNRSLELGDLGVTLSEKSLVAS